MAGIPKPKPSREKRPFAHDLAKALDHDPKSFPIVAWLHTEVVCFAAGYNSHDSLQNVGCFDCFDVVCASVCGRS